jgi:hypothetical protein
MRVNSYGWGCGRLSGVDGRDAGTVELLLQKRTAVWLVRRDLSLTLVV